MRIPIAGTGALTPFGLGIDLVWEALCEGRTAVAPLASPLDLCRPGYGAQVTARWPDLRPLPGAKGHRPATMTRYAYLGCGGIGSALADAAVDLENGSLERGLFVGSYCNMDLMKKYIQLSHVVADRASWEGGPHRIDDSRVMLGMKRFTGFEYLKLMNNMPTAHGGIQGACKGPCNTFLGFAAAGLQAIGRAARAIEDGQAEVMIAGGVGSSVSDQMLMTRGYRWMVASPEMAPEEACRPFDRGATGIVPGEAGCFVVLGEPGVTEDAEAKSLGAITGFATAYEPPAAHPGIPAGIGAAVSAARAALAEAGKQPDLVALTGWSWPKMDELEAALHAEVLGDRAAAVPVLTLGHALGSTEAASGPLGLAVALRALAEGQAPALPTLQDPIPQWKGPVQPEPVALAGKTALVLSFSLEGSHAAIVAEG
jgi:3-oxoacyl-(acyl-carrier-protein) synthase